MLSLEESAVLGPIGPSSPPRLACELHLKSMLSYESAPSKWRGREVSVDFAEARAALSVCVDSAGKLIAVGCAPTDAIVWDAGRSEALQILVGHTNWVVSLAFAKDGRLLISGAGDSTARVWDRNTGKEIGRIRFPGESTYVESVGFSPAGRTVFALSSGRLIMARVPEPDATQR